MFSDNDTKNRHSDGGSVVRLLFALERAARLRDDV